LVITSFYSYSIYVITSIKKLGNVGP